MQYSLTIDLTSAFRTLYATEPEQAVLNLLEANKTKVELMLQGYHSREKVRHVEFVAGSLEMKEAGKGTLQANYQLEEFNVCSAIDRVDTEKMVLSFAVQEAGQTLELKGIYIAEREPDTF